MSVGETAAALSCLEILAAPRGVTNAQELAPLLATPTPAIHTHTQLKGTRIRLSFAIAA